MGGISAVGGAVRVQAPQVPAPIEEASESAATTKLEASQGDPQAVLKLARMRQQTRTPAPAPKAVEVAKPAEAQQAAPAKAAPAAAQGGAGKTVDVLA